MASQLWALALLLPVGVGTGLPPKAGLLHHLGEVFMGLGYLGVMYLRRQIDNANQLLLLDPLGSASWSAAASSRASMPFMPVLLSGLLLLSFLLN